ncbi:hypothetical protein U9M48_022775, partial [Paspalum notatum var. saurae]
MAYMSTFMQQLSASLGPEVNLPPFCPPVFTSQQGQQPPQAWTPPQGQQAWTLPQGPQGSGGWPAWSATQASQIAPQGSQMPHRAFSHLWGGCNRVLIGYQIQVPTMAIGFGHFRLHRYEHYIELSSRPGNMTPDAEVDPNKYLRNSIGRSGSGHNSNNPQ